MKLEIPNSGMPSSIEHSFKIVECVHSKINSFSLTSVRYISPTDYDTANIVGRIFEIRKQSEPFISVTIRVRFIYNFITEVMIIRRVTQTSFAIKFFFLNSFYTFEKDYLLSIRQLTLLLISLLNPCSQTTTDRVGFD